MQYLPGFTDFFISPVSGRSPLTILFPLAPNYVIIGGVDEVPIPSPILIDLRLEIIDLRNRLAETSFILQHPSPNFLKAQALDKLDTGILKQTDGVISIAIPGTDYLTPSLTQNYLWIGDADNKAAEFPRIQVGNLPTMLSADVNKLLGAYNLYSGSPNPLTLGEPEIILRVNITNLPDLTVGKLWYGTDSSNPLNYGANRPVEIEVLPLTNMADLPTDNVWVGDGSNRPVASPVIPLNILYLPQYQIWVGDEDNRPSPRNRIYHDNLPSYTPLEWKKIWRMDITGIPQLSDDLTNLEVNVNDILGQISDILQSIASIASDIASIFSSINSILENIARILSAIDSILETLSGLEITIELIEEEISALDAEVAANTADIATLNTEVGTLTTEVATLTAEVETLTSELAALTVEVESIGAELSILEATVAGLVADVALLEATVAALAADVEILNESVASLAEELATLTADVAELDAAVAANTADILVLDATVAALGLSVAANTAAIVSIEATSIELTGDVTGSETIALLSLGGSISTTLNMTLDTIPAPVDDVDMNGYQINNLAMGFFPSDTDAVNVGYLTSVVGDGSITLTGDVTGSGTVGTPFATTLNMTLDTIPAPVGNVSMNGYQINNLSMAPSPANTDAVNVGYVSTVMDGALGVIVARLDTIDGEILSLQGWQAIETGYMTVVQGQIVTLFGLLGDATVTLTGDVTGSGTTGVPFATTLNMTLDTIPHPVANVDMDSFQINNLAMSLTPASTDAVNVAYLSAEIAAAISAGTINLTGDVTGSGVIGTPFATTLNMTLDTIPVPVANVSLNSHKITSLATPTSGTDAATKAYVDSAVTTGAITLTGNVTGSGVVGTPFATTLALSLDQIPLATSNVNINTHRIINVVDPVSAQDGATKHYIDNSTITLTGNVTGSGLVNGSFATILNMTLDTIPHPVTDVSLNSHKITSLATPTVSTDAATKGYVDSAVVAGTIVLTGNVTGSGVIGTPFATTLVLSLDQITVAAANVNLNTHKLINVVDPTSAQDAATKHYVDGAISAGTIVLTGDVTGSGVIGAPLATALSTNISVHGSNNSQTFTFNNTSSEFDIVNSFVPTLANTSTTSSYLKNNAGHGYRFRQVTSLGGAVTGDFFFDQFLGGGGSPTNLIHFDATANNFTILWDTNFSGSIFCGLSLKFGNYALNRKISLFETVANDHQYYGFGINLATLRYQVDSTASDHVFYAGTSSTTSNEVGRIKGTGDCIIPGTSYAKNLCGCIAMTNNATGFTANNTWVKATGTTTSSYVNGFTASTNRLTYTDATQSPVRAKVSATVSWTYNSIFGDVIYFGIVKNGTPTAYYLPKTNSGLGVYQITSLEIILNFATNDYVEIWGQATGGSTITPWGMSLTVVRV
jgi:predicted  nucleic acid-binding Zn-ribbon protein